MSANNWSSFWKRPGTAFDQVMRVSTDYFGERVRRHFSLKPGDVVLDYGCGPGFLMDNLVATDITIVGADISEFFLEQNRQRYPSARFVHLSADSNETVEILARQLQDISFDHIIVLSILQYFRSHADVEIILKQLSMHLKPKGDIIVADVLDENTSSVADAFGIFKQCIRRGRIIAFVRFILYLMFSDYKSISRKNALLHVPENVIRQIAEQNGLAVRKVSGLTPHPTRNNFILSRT